MKIVVDVYFDTQSHIRGLVSVVSKEDGKVTYVQTVGSAVVGSDELDTMIRAAQYTLNAFVK